MLQLQTINVDTWLAQASCRFLVGAYHIPENEITDCLYDGEKGKGEVEANNKYMKNYNKNIMSSYLIYLDANNLYRWAMSQNLPMNGFKWVKNLSQFNESFIKNYDENSDIGYFLEIHINYREKLFNLHKDLPFLPKRKIKQKNLFVAWKTKKNMLFIQES